MGRGQPALFGTPFPKPQAFVGEASCHESSFLNPFHERLLLAVCGCVYLAGKMSQNKVLIYGNRPHFLASCFGTAHSGAHFKRHQTHPSGRKICCYMCVQSLPGVCISGQAPPCP